MITVKQIDNTDKIIREIENTKQKALLMAGLFVQARAVENTNPNVDTGLLQSSIEVRLNDDYALIGTTIEYAPYLEFGTGIYAVNGNGRKTPWFYKYDGNKRPRGWYFTRGSRPYPFLRPALYENYDEIKRIIKTEMGKI